MNFGTTDKLKNRKLRKCPKQNKMKYSLIINLWFLADIYVPVFNWETGPLSLRRNQYLNN